MPQEELTPLGFVNFANSRGLLSEPGKARQKTSVGRVSPPHVARAAPPIGAQRIKATVVANPVIGIGLHGVGCVVAKRCPDTAPSGSLRGYQTQRRPALRISKTKCGVKRAQNLSWFIGDDGFGGTAG